MKAMQYQFCNVPTPSGKLVYAGPLTREEFDRIPIPPEQLDWVFCSTQTLVKSDGRRWERCVTAKSLFDAVTGITVIFQWCDYRPAQSVGDDPTAARDSVEAVTA